MSWAGEFTPRTSIKKVIDGPRVSECCVSSWHIAWQLSVPHAWGLRMALIPWWIGWIHPTCIYKQIATSTCCSLTVSIVRWHGPGFAAEKRRLVVSLRHRIHAESWSWHRNLWKQATVYERIVNSYVYYKQLDTNCCNCCSVKGRQLWQLSLTHSATKYDEIHFRSWVVTRC